MNRGGGYKRMSIAGMEEIIIIQMGGTIDKDYPRTKGGYDFEIGEPAAKNILNRIRPTRSIISSTHSICRKDSQDITDHERVLLANKIEEGSEKRVIVTHGTDTLLDTARFLASHLKMAAVTDVTVILTGAFTPEKFKDSDADFNLGVAIGAVQSVTPGIWVAMNG
ncbi:unnamed protein product [Meganyctiphanes norvegica]|uniref:L-asparaginase N-terminal domain-containing protein n=1 Tax=Meganyctiphanes norvegica TaxID=48144 RepID=A0AAV2QUS3_MEGNR